MPQTPISAFAGQQLGGTTFIAGQFGKQREFSTGQRHGKYYAGSYAGTSYYASNTAGVTIVAMAAYATYVGMSIANPAGSGVNCVIKKLSGAAAAIGSGNTYQIMWAVGTGTSTPVDTITPLNNISGGSITASATVVSANTAFSAAPVLWRPMAPTQIVAGTFKFSEDVDGECILPPGKFGCFVTIQAATASAFMGAITWEEVAI